MQKFISMRVNSCAKNMCTNRTTRPDSCTWDRGIYVSGTSAGGKIGGTGEVCPFPRNDAKPDSRQYRIRISITCGAMNWASIYDNQRKTFVYDLAAYNAVIIISDAPITSAEGKNSIYKALAHSGNQNITLVQWKE